MANGTVTTHRSRPVRAQPPGHRAVHPVAPGRHHSPTGLSQATCVRVLDTLCQNGYVSRRQSDKSYGLGPALIALGDAARAGFGPLEVARPLMEEVRAELGLPWTASAVVGDRIVVLDRSANQGNTAELTRPGMRYQFTPPSGVIFVAWDTDEAIAEWLARPPLVTGELDHALFMDVVASCRSRGYVVERLSESTSIADSLLAGIVNNDVPPSMQEALNRAVSDSRSARDYLVTELDRSIHLPVGNIAAGVSTSMAGRFCCWACPSIATGVHQGYPAVCPATRRRQHPGDRGTRWPQPSATVTPAGIVSGLTDRRPGP